MKRRRRAWEQVVTTLSHERHTVTPVARKHRARAATGGRRRRGRPAARHSPGGTKRSLRILACGGLAAAAAAIGLTAAQADPPSSSTTTPIKHVVVIFGENVSFDHYFGTYPYATNPAGEPAFHAAPGTPSVNGLTDELLTSNPNLDDPQRLDRSMPITMSGQNVGDLLNAKHVTWGWFEGGFRPTGVDAGGHAVCGSQHTNVGGGTTADYIPHHEPFEYYASTANPHHLPPSSADMIGRTDQANHQYDLSDFDTALANGNLPAVSFLKASGFEDGHPGYSGPLDEQTFIANEIDAIERSPEWKDTAIVLAYDDSDGWYDHVMPPIVSPSAAPSDALNGPGKCGNVKDSGAYPDRCGYGPRLPLLVVSPYAKTNFVDNTLTDQSSILRFVEDNWQLGRIGDRSFDARAGTLLNMFDFGHREHAKRVFLDPSTGEVVHGDQ